MLKHVGRAAEGSTNVLHTSLEEIVERRTLRFSIDVTAEDDRTIGVGTRERRVIGAGR